MGTSSSSVAAFGVATLTLGLGAGPSAAADDGCDVGVIKRHETAVAGLFSTTEVDVTVDANHCPHRGDDWTWLVFSAMADQTVTRDPVVVRGATPEPALRIATAITADDGTLVLELESATPLTLVAIPPGQGGVTGLHLKTNSGIITGVVAEKILLDGRDVIEFLNWAGAGSAPTLDTARTRKFFRPAVVRSARFTRIGEVSVLRPERELRSTPRPFQHPPGGPPEGDFPPWPTGDSEET
jgi:hypothetical protein